MPRGRKLVVQLLETFREHMEPAFVERLDAWKLAESAGMALPPIMIYGDDVTHVLTEEGVQEFLRQIPHAKVVDVGGAAHMVAGDQNDAFSDAVIAFLEFEVRPRLGQ